MRERQETNRDREKEGETDRGEQSREVAANTAEREIARTIEAGNAIA